MAHTVRCPMRECRRSIDLEVLPHMPERPVPSPCLHYIASWGLDRGSMVEEVLFGLDGSRELIIRNVRPTEITADMIDPIRTDLENAAREFAREVAETTPDGSEMMWALFGDQHERDAASRVMAQLIIGPDPMISRVAG